jgi:hypothetical protein
VFLFGKVHKNHFKPWVAFPKKFRDKAKGILPIPTIFEYTKNKYFNNYYF